MSFLTKLQSRWQLDSIKQVVLVLIVFTLTGSTAVYVRRPIYEFLEISSSPFYVKILAALFIIIPIYQVLLLAYGFIFGQFAFFLAFEKKSFGRIAKLFRK